MNEDRREVTRRLFERLRCAGFDFEFWPGGLQLCPDRPDLTRTLGLDNLVIRQAGWLTPEQLAFVKGYRAELIDLVANMPVWRRGRESAN